MDEGILDKREDDGEVERGGERGGEEASFVREKDDA